MSIDTYGYLFKGELLGRIERCGKLERILRWIDLYRNPDSPGRSADFYEWAKDTGIFMCEFCESGFRPDPTSIKEEDRVVCLSERCIKDRDIYMEKRYGRRRFF